MWKLPLCDLPLISRMFPVELERPMLTEGSELERKTRKLSDGSTIPSRIVGTLKQTSRSMLVSVRDAKDAT